MRAAIYIRVSTSEQAEDGYSLEAQERACRLYCELQNWRVAEIYKDDGYSGTSAKRPDFQRLLADAGANRFDVVLVHKLDRFARNLSLMMDIVKAWLDKNISFVSISEQMDFGMPMGKLVLQILGAVAEWYIDNLRVETKKGHTEKAQQGGWSGPVPLGYRMEYTWDSEGNKISTGRLLPSDDAPAIVLIFELYASGRHSYTSIADELNTIGYRTLDWQTGERGLFGRESVRWILKNKAYLGIISRKGQEYEGKHEALISQALWHRAHAIRESRAEKQGRISVSSGGGLLSGMARCAACGENMWHHISRDEGRVTLYYYICAGRDHRTCKAVLCRTDTVERQLVAELERYIIPDDWRDEIVRRIAALAKSEQRRPGIDPATIKEQIRRLTKTYQLSMIDDQEFDSERARLQALLDDVQPHRAPVLNETTIRAAIDQFSTLSTALHGVELDARRALLRRFFSKLWLEKSELKAITPTGIYLPLIGAMHTLHNSVGMGWLMGSGLSIPTQPFLPIWTDHRQPWASV